MFKQGKEERAGGTCRRRRIAFPLFSRPKAGTNEALRKTNAPTRLVPSRHSVDSVIHRRTDSARPRQQRRGKLHLAGRIRAALYALEEGLASLGGVPADMGSGKVAFGLPQM